MFSRNYWLGRIREAWNRRSVIWLMGVRRVGKTVLAQSLPDADYFDCEMPRVRQRLADPEAFLEDHSGGTVVLDEVHRLADPTELLKIAADHHSGTRILATGSSSLSASAKFSDTLAGRKEEVWLTPMIADDVRDFGQEDLRRRLLRGGLPEFYLAAALPQLQYQEWVDAFWARDILDLFRLEKRFAFLRFVELIMQQSGGIFEATRFARPCEVSRQTISNYLAVLEATFVAQVIRPYSGRPSAELVAAPKVYGFDTGFVCFFQGWVELLPEYLGVLWEHLVLNELLAKKPAGTRIHYWRTKHGNEIDFVLAKRGQAPIVVECKWSAADPSLRNVGVFRRHYPEGGNFIVAADVDGPFTRDYKGLQVRFIGLKDLATEVG